MGSSEVKDLGKTNTQLPKHKVSDKKNLHWKKSKIHLLLVCLVRNRIVVLNFEIPGLLFVYFFAMRGESFSFRN